MRMLTGDAMLVYFVGFQCFHWQALGAIRLVSLTRGTTGSNVQT